MASEAPEERQRYIKQAPSVMEQLALPHVNAEGSRLRLLPLPEETVSGSAVDPLCYRFEGNRQPIAITDMVAAQTEPRFPALMESLQDDANVREAIHATGELLENRQSVWVVSPHGDILDIAYVVKATYNLLDQQGYEPRRTISILSKALGRMGFELQPGLDPIPTVDTMGMQCDDVFLTWPRTKSAEGPVSELPQAEVDFHNRRATIEMDEEFAEGGVLAAMAPTGTTRMATDRSGALVLPVPTLGTLKLMMKEHTHVLPVPAWFKQGEAAMMTFPIEPLEISSERQVHEMLKYLAEVMTESVEGTDFTYRIPKRAIMKAALDRHKHPKT